MDKKLNGNAIDCETEFGTTGSSRPIRKSLGKRASTHLSRTTRRKKSIASRKESTKGGIHQRGNKRMNW
ncbi:MAG: hypothetical protein MKZ95_00565 [Pirellulales bacterium]|nr:hypothetical protein [Pirellulales bacterium]